MIHQLLEKPLAVFDIESTGLNRKMDRIIDLAIVFIHPDGNRTTRTWRVNPEQAIPPGATAVHGITDEDVKDAPRFSAIAAEVAHELEDCDLGGFNILRFDIPMLQEEFLRAGVPFSMDGRRVVDMQRIYHMKEPRDLSAALQFYCESAHVGAHGALSDVEASIQVFEAQLKRYADLPASMDELDRLCNPKDASWADSTGKLKWVGKELVINFGQKTGSRLHDLLKSDQGYLQWMLKRDFPDDTKWIIREALNGRMPDPPGPATPEN
jgi:DNA polymerase-3 subunit epsilon